MKTTTITAFLTHAQIEEALSVARAAKARGQTPVGAICKRVIEPNMVEINRRLGQENDPMYLAYAVEYVLTRTGHL